MSRSRPCRTCCPDGTRSQTIKDSTADRVREAASRLGYRRNDAARAIRTGKSDLVLLSLNVLADPWSQAVAARSVRR